MDEKGQDVATTVLVSEIDGATEQIKAAKYATCPAHEPMARGLVVLLQVAKAQLIAKHDYQPIASGTGVSTGLATTISVVVAAVMMGLVTAAKSLGWID